VAIRNICIELGSGVFDKPQALGDYLIQIKAEKALVICPNSSDIRFVENILRRRSIPARRITEFLENNEISQIADWLQSQQNIVVVCGVKAGLKISELWNSCILLYSPLADIESFEQIIRSDKDASDTNEKIVATLVSPQELPQYLVIKKQLGTVDTIQVTEQDSILAQKEILDRVIQNLPSRGSTLATELTREYAKDLGMGEIDPTATSFTTLKKLLSFLMEQNLGSAKNSIEEELQLVSSDSQDETDSDDRSNWNSPSGGKKNHRNNNRNGRGDTSSYSNTRNKKNSGQGKRNYNERDRKGPKRDRQKPQFFPVRIYVGLGEDNGVKPHEVKDFISKHADVDREEIGFATVRTSYSFVDLTKDAAEKALSKESGYEYEGKLITVERALTANPPRRKPSRGHSHSSQEASE
jgi:hypothetical protein